jgi:homoserine kinase type II
VQPGLIAELDTRLAAVLADWPDALPRGHIHADLFPDNVFFLPGADGRPEVSGLIDFYFACTDFLAYDLAICLNAWCFETDGAFNVTKARGLVGAYDAARPLTAAEREALPVLCRGAALRFLLTRLYDWTHTPDGALVTRKDPLEYLRKLRFFAGADSFAALGL